MSMGESIVRLCHRAIKRLLAASRFGRFEKRQASLNISKYLVNKHHPKKLYRPMAESDFVQCLFMNAKQLSILATIPVEERTPYDYLYSVLDEEQRAMLDAGIGDLTPDKIKQLFNTTLNRSAARRKDGDVCSVVQDARRTLQVAYIPEYFEKAVILWLVPPPTKENNETRFLCLTKGKRKLEPLMKCRVHNSVFGVGCKGFWEYRKDDAIFHSCADTDNNGKNANPLMLFSQGIGTILNKLIPSMMESQPKANSPDLESLLNQVDPSLEHKLQGLPAELHGMIGEAVLDSLIRDRYV